MTDTKAATKTAAKDKPAVHVVLTEANAGGRIAVGPYQTGKTYLVAADMAEDLIARKGFTATTATAGAAPSEG